MLQNLAAEIINCYERARLAREEAERASNDDFKADFLAGGWHLPTVTSCSIGCREQSRSSTAAGKLAQSHACSGNKVPRSALLM